MNKARLAKAFDAAAATYDANAPIQRATAERLAARIAALPLPARPRILEIGCGTGFLTQALRQRLGPADWTITDLSPAMLAACRARLEDPEGATFRVMDGERPDLSPGDGFDLVCASLAFQWFDDLDGALQRLSGLLRPGGWLAFATLAEGTLEEWRVAHAELGLKAGTPDFPSLEALSSMLGGPVEGERLIHVQADGRALVRGLKAIGAASPEPGRAPLSPATFKQVMARFEARGAASTYHVAYGTRRKAAAPRGVFITGTDTGVGKTIVSACLARAWDVDYWKPVQTGLAEEDGDTAIVARLAALSAGRLHPPRHALAAPLSPDAAAAREGITIRLEDFALPASDRPVVVEGAGGPLVPLSDQALTIDLMVKLGLPVVLVAADRLGAISQTLLALEGLRARSLQVLGVVLTGGPFADNRAAIETHGKVRILAELPHADVIAAERIAEWARLFASLPRSFGEREGPDREAGGKVRG